MFLAGAAYAADRVCNEIPNASEPLSPPFLDCTGASWTVAFAAMHTKISQEYAFTNWRGIDWQSLYNKFLPLIVRAEADNDEAAYYQILRQYFLGVHDGHVSISPPEWDPLPLSLNFITAQITANVGGDYGLIITPTSNGAYVVSYLTPRGSASSANIKLGDEVVSWNNIPIA